MKMMMKLAALVVATFSLVACTGDADGSDPDVHPEKLDDTFACMLQVSTKTADKTRLKSARTGRLQ
jgi:hypothetical protein